MRAAEISRSMIGSVCGMFVVMLAGVTFCPSLPVVILKKRVASNLCLIIVAINLLRLPWEHCTLYCLRLKMCIVLIFCVNDQMVHN